MFRVKLERFQHNEAGFVQLLKSSEMQADLRARAQRIAGAAGPGHVVDSQLTRERARAAVITATVEAMFNEATKHTLLKAIDRGRG